MVTGRGPYLVNPTFRFGVPQGGKVGAVGDLTGRLTNPASLVRTSVKLLTLGHFAALIGASQESDIRECLATARADHRKAYRRLPVGDGHENLAGPH